MLTIGVKSKLYSFKDQTKVFFFKKIKKKEKLTTTHIFLYTMWKTWFTIGECKKHMAQLIHPY
jgi:hypothetical protein